MKIKLHEDDRMVEIPIGQMHHYVNRVEVGIILKTHTMAKNEDDSALLAEEVVMQLIEMLKEHYANGNHEYGVEITNYTVGVHDTEIAEEEE